MERKEKIKKQMARRNNDKNAKCVPLKTKQTNSSNRRKAC